MLPSYQDLMLPILQCVAQHTSISTRALSDVLVEQLNIPEKARQQKLKSGQLVLTNRISWASIYLRKSGLLESKARGMLSITKAGQRIAKDADIDAINNQFLMQFPSFAAFMQASRAPQIPKEKEVDRTSLERLEAAHHEINTQLALSLKEKILSASPAFFEKLVIELLLAMGYGGSMEDAGAVIGQTGDGGIDGIIKADRLGLDNIYVQAKRWQGTVGEPAIRDFVGALTGYHGANKGVFITTGKFSKNAQKFFPKNGAKVVLVDGELLTKLMIEYNIGVSDQQAYVVKTIDIDFFDSE
ncbi:restriction endonuclease [Wohlfahrtiimonas chitiniclastica]|uniref:restriction endonuclease n=1 Tax=Wohlfahrtiimonas chitiniclastica TaxID=400946 RepID=UPI0007B4089F|nr:restriction endonuclease [Wohlfahrtiimonas chitiniclastica]KZS22543.1 Mrr restriction system protein [Wohlfahrtiimonas chitiniclastica]MDC7251354.1 restriction endonuclease [Wohlfahrtiimonas chitiniclastica]WHR55020.1 restriction endonuclease [Wohlfahrtiimonas chitiniclastica]